MMLTSPLNNQGDVGSGDESDREVEDVSQISTSPLQKGSHRVVIESRIATYTYYTMSWHYNVVI